MKMIFRTESEMTAPVRRWLLRQGFSHREEVQTPWGICDLVGARLNKAVIKQRETFRQVESVGAPIRFTLLDSMPQKECGNTVTVKGLMSKLKNALDEQDIRNHLKFLLKKNIIFEVKKNHFVRIGDWMEEKPKLIAIELKLDRISDVINQALQNKRLTSNSFVGLPMNKASSLRKDALDDIQKNGLGLLGVAKGRVSVIIDPSGDTDEYHRAIAANMVERFYADYFKGNSS